MEFGIVQFTSDRGLPPQVLAPLIEQAGFEALYLSGASIAYTRLGRSDVGLTTFSEVQETLAAITERAWPSTRVAPSPPADSGSAIELAQDVNKTTLQERMAQQARNDEPLTYSDPKVKRTGGL